MEPLNEKEGWSLFCKKAFPSDPTHICPIDLEPLALKLVDKCKGLPLAIVTLGGLMSSRSSIIEWIEIHNNLKWQLNNDQNLEVVKGILLLSFNDLPYRLKQCFLYCCLFPEDYLIGRKRLLKLWVAEGFVQLDNRIVPEKVAESYLITLVSRSLLQVVCRNGAGRPKNLKMHDIMREIALSTSERERFCVVYDGRVAIEECRPRRLSAQTIDDNLQSYSGISKVHSFLAFTNDSSSFPNALLYKFKVLKVLDLQDVPISKLPNEVGIFFNLRYLNLGNTQLAMLPKSIAQLLNLEILDIQNTLIKELPHGMRKLQKLRNLIMYCYDWGFINNFQFVSGTRVPFQISKLKKLQVVSCIEVEGDIIREIGSMIQLTRVGISNVKAADEADLCSSITNLKRLNFLFLMVTDEMESLVMDELESPPPELQKLVLVGKLEKVPHWFCSLQCLTYLHLRWSRLSEDLLPPIATLNNLGALSLSNAFVGEKLHFQRGFSKLKELFISNSHGLTDIIIEKGVMPNIHTLFLFNYMGLNELPEGIEYLTNLQKLLLKSVPENLIKSIRLDQSKMQHIPDIRHYPAREFA